MVFAALTSALSAAGSGIASGATAASGGLASMGASGLASAGAAGGGGFGSSLFALFSQAGNSPLLKAGLQLAPSLLGSASKNSEADLARDLAGLNAKALKRQARDAIDRGRELERDYRQGLSQLLGTQRVAVAANGFELDAEGTTSSALAISTAEMAEVDVARIRNSALREAHALRHGAKLSRFQGELAAFQAEAGGSESLFGGLLKGAGVLDKFAQSNPDGGLFDFLGFGGGG